MIGFGSCQFCGKDVVQYGDEADWQHKESGKIMCENGEWAAEPKHVTVYQQSFIQALSQAGKAGAQAGERFGKSILNESPEIDPPFYDLVEEKIKMLTVGDAQELMRLVSQFISAHEIEDPAEKEQASKRRVAYLVSIGADARKTTTQGCKDA